MKNFRKLVSPHFNDRVGVIAPKILILHYTGTTTAQEAEDYYMDIKRHAQSGPVSPHYMIDRDGSVTQFVDESKRAWHAGKSWWAGDQDINSHSIGIELVNPGHDHGYIPFTQDQMDSLRVLVTDILQRNPIPPHHVLGHTDIAPTRKPDPGELMDWPWLAAHGIGLWPKPDQDDYDMAAALYPDETSLRDAFTEYGYDPNISTTEVISAFQRHFQPEAHLQNRAGKVDADTAARLHWLLKMKNSYKP